MGEAAVVGAVEVVVVDVLFEVALEAGEADVEVAGEGGTPALFEDQAVERFDGAVRHDPEPLEPPPPGSALLCCARPEGDVVLDA